jgi:hypothetical protein
MRNTGHACDALMERLASLDKRQRAALAGELEHIGEYLETVGGLIRRSVQSDDLDNALVFTQLAEQAVAVERLSRI